ncbi:MAG: DUF2474 domain-containing protein [Lysobacteraceae bacterium]|nr:MAG: DUF2474 domain-containing protein [Xanthomonadaceae bacterium]
MHARDDADRRPLARRLAWLVLYWLAGVASVGALALLVRIWLR